MGTRFLRSFPWISRALDPVGPGGQPVATTDVLATTLDVVGTSHLDRVLFVELRPTLAPGIGALEASHTRVPADAVRFYLSGEWWHDDPAGPFRLRPGRIIQSDDPFTPQFAFAAFGSMELIADDFHVAVGSFVVPPLGFFAVQADPGLTTPGTRIFARLTWVDVPLGEYVTLGTQV